MRVFDNKIREHESSPASALYEVPLMNFLIIAFYNEGAGLVAVGEGTRAFFA